MARQASFAFLVSAVPALLPVVGLRRLGLGTSSLGLLYSALGAGSVAAALFPAQPLRRRLSPNRLTTLTGDAASPQELAPPLGRQADETASALGVPPGGTGSRRGGDAQRGGHRR